MQGSGTTTADDPGGADRGRRRPDPRRRERRGDGEGVQGGQDQPSSEARDAQARAHEQGGVR